MKHLKPYNEAYESSEELFQELNNTCVSLSHVLKMYKKKLIEIQETAFGDGFDGHWMPEHLMKMINDTNVSIQASNEFIEALVDELRM